MLGIKLSDSDFSKLKLLVVSIICYYAVMFVVYAHSELLSLRQWSIEEEGKYRARLMEIGKDHGAISDEGKEDFFDREAFERALKHGIRSNGFLRLRLNCELILPLVISIIAILVVLFSRESNGAVKVQENPKHLECLHRHYSLHGVLSGQTLKQMSNNPCHPNPTALVGNWLTDRGNVIKLVEAR